MFGGAEQAGESRDVQRLPVVEGVIPEQPEIRVVIDDPAFRPVGLGRKRAAADAAAKAKAQADAAKAAASDKTEQAKAAAEQARRTAQEKAEQFKAQTAGAQDKAKEAQDRAKEAAMKAKEAADQAASKAGEAVHKNRGKIDSGVDRAARLIDEKTQGKATGVVQKVKEIIATVLDKTEGRRTAGAKVENAAQDVESRIADATTDVQDKVDGDNRF